MSANKDALDNVLSLSMQLNRQAFATPPVDGWLDAFLSMLYERFASDSVRGLQIAQVIENFVVQKAQVGNVPASASDPYSIEDLSPVATAIKAREMVSGQDLHVFPLTVGDSAIGVLNVFASQLSPEMEAAFTTLALQLGVAMENARLYSQTAQRTDIEQLMNRTAGNMQQGGDMQSMLLNTLQQVAKALNARRARVRLELLGAAQGNEQAAGKLVGQPAKQSRKKEA